MCVETTVRARFPSLSSSGSHSFFLFLFCFPRRLIRGTCSGRDDTEEFAAATVYRLLVIYNLLYSMHNKEERRECRSSRQRMRIARETLPARLNFAESEMGGSGATACTKIHLSSSFTISIFLPATLLFRVDRNLGRGHTRQIGPGFGSATFSTSCILDIEFVYRYKKTRLCERTLS